MKAIKTNPAEEAALALPKALPADYAETRDGGLTDEEAAALRAQGQGNQASADPGKSVLRILADNLFTLFNLLNILLAAALAAVSAYRNMLFLGVVVSNTLIGTVQELRAKRTVERLKLLNEGPIRVMRDGTERLMPGEDSVRGDLVVLRAGSQVPADAILRSGSCAVSEALLTGESDPVLKNPGDWLYSGSYLTVGACVCQLVHVGDASYINRLSRAAKKIKPPRSALMSDLNRIVRAVTAVLIPLGALLFCKQFFLSHDELYRSVTSSVAAMIGMIPEGLILLASVALAVGVMRLGRQRTLVQELYGIETLARVDTLCLDKTGTLTTGGMALDSMVPLEATEEEARAALSRFLGASDTSSATLTALVHAVKPGQERASTILPFSSERKKSAVSFDDAVTLVLGAPSFVLGPLYEGRVKELTEEAAARSLRVVVLAECVGMIRMNDTPPIRRILALFMISDELRPEAPEGLRYFREQGVTVKVISGDDPRTVSAIAEKAGLEGASAHAVDVSLLSDEEVAEAAEKNTVFGRVTPDRKQMLVAALQKAGHSVAMTGDGVNDIPAMKTADCSIAMASGADAARHAAQLILLDSDFTALPRVVAEGRRVINNIARTASLFLVKTIYSLLLSVLALCLPISYPFQPIQLTLISSLTVGAPSFFLALEPNAERVKGRFLRNVMMRALPGGIAVALCGLAAAFLTAWWPAAQASTMATLAAGYVGLLMLASVCWPFSRLRAAVLAAMAGLFTAAVLVFGHVFFLTPLDGMQLAAQAGLAALGTAVMIVLRWLLERRDRKEASA